MIEEFIMMIIVYCIETPEGVTNWVKFSVFSIIQKVWDELDSKTFSGIIFLQRVVLPVCLVRDR